MKKYSIHNFINVLPNLAQLTHPLAEKLKIEKKYTFNAQTVKTPNNQPTVIHSITPNTHNL